MKDINKDFITITDSFIFWIFGLLSITFFTVTYSVNQTIVFSLLISYIYPLSASYLIFISSKFIKDIKFKKIFSYILFFSISATSYFSITKIMDGSHATSENILLFGLSFYTVTLAYTLYTKHVLTISDVFISSNPILIITGPIMVSIKVIKYKSLRKRVKYFLPYIIFGLFLLEVISTSLTPTFYLSESLDAVSTIGFAIIFECFIYSNFCGFSLIIYGFSGILGYLIPLNFKQPFSSATVMDFWKGWHISLSNALKELFYIPVRKKTNVYIATFCVFISSAMWHGVSATFLLWGMLHFFSFSLTIFLIKKKIMYLNTIILFIAIILGRLIFLESDLDILLEKLSFKYAGFGFFAEIASLPKINILGICIIIGIIISEHVFKNNLLFKNRNYKFYRLNIAQLILSILIIVSASESSGLLYPVYGQR